MFLDFYVSGLCCFETSRFRGCDVSAIMTPAVRGFEILSFRHFDISAALDFEVSRFRDCAMSGSHDFEICNVWISRPPHLDFRDFEISIPGVPTFRDFAISIFLYFGIC